MRRVDVTAVREFTIRRNGGRLERSAEAVLVDPEPLDLRFEGRRGNAELRRRAAGARDAALRRGERLLDRALLLLAQSERRRAARRLLDHETVALGEDRRPLDPGLELPHVAGPGVLEQALHGPPVDTAELLAQARAVARGEVLDEDRDVLPAIPQRRDFDREDV